MENYFQTEAYNLDKVLDEFEQNEDETISPTLLETKWSQILDPPPQRLTLNPALANVNESTISKCPEKLKSFSLSHIATTSIGGGDYCFNGQNPNMSQENTNVWIDDQTTTDDQLVMRNSNQNIQCNSADDEGKKCGSIDCLPEGKNVLVVAVMHNCDKKALQNDLLGCKSFSSPPSMDTVSFTLDNEVQETNHLHITVNGSVEKDTDTEKEPVLATSLNASEDSINHDIAAAAAASNCSSSDSLLKEENDNANKDNHFSQTTASGIVIPFQRAFDPSIKVQEQNASVEDLNTDVVAQKTELETESSSPNTHNDSFSFKTSVTDMAAHSSDCQEMTNEELTPQNEMGEQINTENEAHNGMLEIDTDLKGSSINELENSSPTDVTGTSLSSGLPNYCDSYGIQNSVIAHIPKTLPSKEDSVTEEKEIEESKSESYSNVYEQRGNEATERSGLTSNCSGDQMRKQCLHNLCNQIPSESTEASVKSAAHLQSLSVPFGGARPKQPTNLTLQIPKPLLDHLQNDLVPPNCGGNSKNKNDISEKIKTSENVATNIYADETVQNALVTDARGEHADDYDSVVSNSSCLATASDSPDNDLGAGQSGVHARKPFTNLGEVAPVWVPDSQAPNCMKCEARFTFTKRRHHCRACGKVFCAACCSLKCKLLYMDRKEARVCVICHLVLMNAQSLKNMLSAPSPSPNPNNPAEYCSTIPPLQQVQASGVLNSPPPTVMVPVGVLKHPGTEVSQPREQRRVWFADGILPNGEVADAAKLTVSGTSSTGALAVSHDPSKPISNNTLPEETENTLAFSRTITQVGSPVGSAMNLIPEDGLPPILISTGVKGDYTVEEKPSHISVMQQLEDGGPDPLVFVLNANLLSMVKIVNYVNRKCWCFTTKGMHAVGQSEIVILLQCLPDEKCLPKDIFNHFVQLYQDALAGNVVSNLGHSFFSQNFLNSKEHGGFLYVTPAYQSLQDLVLPTPPYLFGILIQKWETPWAKVFPIRLMLRLGAEYRLYPCPLFSVRFRKPLFGETGHTIMNLLADFRNYQYTLPVVQGLVVDMEVRKTSIKIPSNRYNEMMKAMNKSNEHVLAGGACFNERADSHLVCVQNDDGNYQTQAISIHNQPRKVTGASFFVFSGALKSSSGYLAKSSIVEDGVMVQITAENMDSLRQALREMKDFTISCGKVDVEEPQEHVHIQWVDDDKNFNKGVVSPIDGKSMESIISVKIFHGSEYKANGKVIRWTEVFFLENDDQHNGLSDPADHSRLTENVAKAFCLALCPHLKLLKEDGMTKLGLRVTLDTDQVGYQAGSNGQPLPVQYMNDLDSALVPVIHGGACQLSEGPVIMELIFYILENIS
uniref:Zinc finger FYVE domain-containing protein n=1 Tax=Naja naja TaxID=35670 RepID=A0A8C6XTU0_NAJNA